MPNQYTGPAPLAERFWAKVDKDSGRCWNGTACWLWTAGRLPRGYGQFDIAGRKIHAHRLAWEMAHGPIPAGLCCLHRCDTPACVRVAHLFLGTQLQNVTDMVEKGRARGARGARNGSARLTAEQVALIRARAARGPINQRGLAREFGVSHTAIRRLLVGMTWRDLD
jgi:hypothetical protein